MVFDMVLAGMRGVMVRSVRRVARERRLCGSNERKRKDTSTHEVLQNVCGALRPGAVSDRGIGQQCADRVLML